MNPQVPDHAPNRLQLWHINVEVHPVDRFVLKHQMITQHVATDRAKFIAAPVASTGPRTH
jgi:hypothetical protein